MAAPANPIGVSIPTDTVDEICTADLVVIYTNTANHYVGAAEQCVAEARRHADEARRSAREAMLCLSKAEDFTSEDNKYYTGVGLEYAAETLTLSRATTASLGAKVESVDSAMRYVTAARRFLGELMKAVKMLEEETGQEGSDPDAK